MDVKSWKRQQADRTREQLLETASQLFVEKGYADTPMEELVSRAGMTMEVKVKKTRRAKTAA